MNIPEVEGMNILEEHECPSNQWPEKDMDMADIHMVEVEGMNMVEEHERPSKERPEVESIDMVEDMTVQVDVKVVEREHEGVVLAKHWIGDGAERHRRTHREQELAKLGC
jgi:hypothetical protein